MLEKEGFDAWAEEYDRSVRETDEASGRDWDEEESYPVAEEIASRLSGNGFPQMHFRRFSFCAGVMYWQKEN